MRDAIFTPRGPYRLRLMARSETWIGALPGGATVTAWQLGDGRVVVRAASDEAVELARFMLALDDDTAEFHRRFARDPLLGVSARTLVGYRPVRLATVAHAALRAFCGQLIDSRRARAIERTIVAAVATGGVVTRDELARLAPAELRRLGLSQQRSSALSGLVRTLDLERLRTHATDTVLRRLLRERGIGPWSVGVIALEGLGRYDHGLVGDLGLIKLHSALVGRWVEAAETASLLEPYGEWQGLAGEMLMLGWARGLIRGADPDVTRIARRRARKAA